MILKLRDGCRNILRQAEAYRCAVAGREQRVVDEDPPTMSDEQFKRIDKRLEQVVMLLAVVVSASTGEGNSSTGRVLIARKVSEVIDAVKPL